MARRKKTEKRELSHEDIPRNTRATARRLLGRMARQWWKLLLVAGAALLSSASFTAIPLAVGMGIDRLVDAIRAFDGSAGVVETAAGALGLPVLLVAAAALFSSLMSYVQQYIIATVGEELTLSLRQDVSAKLNRLPLRYFDGHKTGDIMSRVTNDLEKVSSVMQVGLMQLVSAVFIIALAAAAMVMLSPRLFLVVLVSLALSMTATGYVSALAQRAYGGNMAAMGALTGKVEELYAGNRVVKVFNRQAAMLEEAEALNEAQFRAQRRAQFADYAIYPAIRVLGQLGFIATAVLGGGMALGGAITLGTVQAFLQYVNQIAEPVTEASYVITSLQAAIAGAERVFALLDEEEERPDAAGDASVITQGHVEFRHVRFGYTPERTLIHDLNLEVRPNEMVAIVGPTGGGKTTLVNLLMRFYELDGGSISIDGQDITALPRGELRRRIGMVLQDAWLFEGTIAENIAYGRRDATREEIVAAARAACCDHFIRTLLRLYNGVFTEFRQIDEGEIAPGVRHPAFRGDHRRVPGTDAAADHRPGHAHRPGHPGVGRGHLQRGYPNRGGDPEGHGTFNGGQDQLCHRPPPVHHPQRGSDPGGAGRRHRGAGHPQGTDGPERLLRLPLPQPVRGGVTGEGGPSLAPGPALLPLLPFL